MAGTWIPDTIEGAQLDAEAFAQRYVRTGLVTGIDVSGDPDPEVLWKVLTVLAAQVPPISLAIPSPLHPVNHPSVLLRRVHVQGITTDGARVVLLYETPDLGPPTAYVIRDSQTLSSIQTDLLPGTRVPLRIPDTTISGGTVIPGDNVLFTVLRPVRQITMSALVYGQPTNSDGFVGRVNSPGWRGKTIGYWLGSQYETDYSKFQGYFTLLMSAMTLNDEDWSQSGMLVDRATGKKVKLIDADAEAASMMGKIYKYGIIHANNGCIRFGPYLTANFTAKFGFS